MPTQQNIQDCLLNASYKLTTLVQRNLALVNRGGVPSNTDTLQFWRFNIVGLQYLYDFGVYSTDTALGLYDRLLGFIGIPANATVDPNFQAPNTTIIVDGGDTGDTWVALEITIPAQASFTYTLSTDELATVNSISGIPIFSIVSNSGAGGTDMYPVYTPYNTPGLYTQIVIQLNSDTATFVAQFSGVEGSPTPPNPFPYSLPIAF